MFCIARIYPPFDSQSVSYQLSVVGSEEETSASNTTTLSSSTSSTAVKQQRQKQPHHHAQRFHVSIVDAMDARARKDAICHAVAADNGDLLREVVHPMANAICPSLLLNTPVAAPVNNNNGDGPYAPRFAQGTIVVDGKRSCKSQILFDPYDGLIVSAVRDLVRRDTTKSVYFSAVELDEHNQLIDLLSEDSKAQRSSNATITSSSSNVAVELKAGVIRSRIPTVVEDTNEQFTAIEDTTFVDVTKSCHDVLQYLKDSCVSNTRHQVYSLVVMHREATEAVGGGGSGDDGGGGASIAPSNTTLQFVSLVLHEYTRGVRATRHSISNAASLLESRSSSVSFTSTKILFLLKYVLMAKQVGAWISLFHPSEDDSDVAAGVAATSVDEPESFKGAFVVLQTLSRVYGASCSSSTKQPLLQAEDKSPSTSPVGGSTLPDRAKLHHAVTGNRSTAVNEGGASTSAPQFLPVGVSTPLRVDQSSTTSREGTVKRAIFTSEQADRRLEAVLQQVPPRPTISGEGPPRRSSQHRAGSASSDDLEPRQQYPQQHHRGPVDQPSARHDTMLISRTEMAVTGREGQAKQNQHLSRAVSSPADNRRRTAARAPYLHSAKRSDMDSDTAMVSMFPLSYDDQQQQQRRHGYPSSRQDANASSDHSGIDASTVNTSATTKQRQSGGSAGARTTPGGVPSTAAPSSAAVIVSHWEALVATERQKSRTLLNNFETYKHTMEGALARLRQDLQTQAAQLDDARRQLHKKEKSIRSGNEGVQAVSRELESLTRKLAATESDSQRLAGEYHHHKASWKAQRAELVKINDSLQLRINDLLETVNGLEGALSKSRESAASRTRGLTSSATTTTTIQGLVNTPHDTALGRLMHDASSMVASSVSRSHPKDGSPSSVSGGSSPAAAVKTFQNAIHATTLVPVGIPRGTQTSFPTSQELQDALVEKASKLAEYEETMVQLRHDLDLVVSREGSLHQRILELEQEVTLHEEQEITLKTNLLKAEQLLRVERQDSERQRRDKEINVMTVGTQASTPLELQDVLIHELETSHRSQQEQMFALTSEVTHLQAMLANEQENSHSVRSELERQLLMVEEELVESRNAHATAQQELEARISDLTKQISDHQEQQQAAAAAALIDAETMGAIRSTNLSPQSLGSSTIEPFIPSSHPQQFNNVQIPQVYREVSAQSRSPNQNLAHQGYHPHVGSSPTAHINPHHQHHGARQQHAMFATAPSAAAPRMNMQSPLDNASPDRHSPPIAVRVQQRRVVVSDTAAAAATAAASPQLHSNSQHPQQQKQPLGVAKRFSSPSNTTNSDAAASPSPPGGNGSSSRPRASSSTIVPSPQQRQQQSHHLAIRGGSGGGAPMSSGMRSPQQQLYQQDLSSPPSVTSRQPGGGAAVEYHNGSGGALSPNTQFQQYLHHGGGGPKSLASGATSARRGGGGGILRGR